MKKLFEKFINFELKDEDTDLCGGILSIIFAVVFFVSTLSTKKSFSSSSIGPKTIPQALSVIVFVLGLSLVIKWYVSFKERKAVKSEEKTGNKEDCSVDAKQIFRKITPFVSFVFLAIYIALMKPIGFTLSSAIYLTLQIPLLSTDLSRKSFLKAFVIAVITSAVTYLLFAKGFALNLPKGPLGF